MADFITKIRTLEGDKQIDYNALANLPDLSKKVDKVEGKGLSTNDYTTAEKNKLAKLNENNIGKHGASVSDEIFNDYVNNQASGSYSHAEGTNNIAQGTGAHAEGNSTTASAQASHAEGGGTQAKSDGAHTEGVNTVAGRLAQADTTNTTKIAQIIAPAASQLGMPFSTSSEQQAAVLKLGGFGSHAEGMGSQALGTSSHAEGNATKALANSTHSEGDSTSAEGEASHAEGYSTKALGNQSHAEGLSTESKGNSAHSEGRYTKAEGYAAHAEGIASYAGANAVVQSHANMDYSGLGVGAHAEGQGTAASGNSAHAEGWKTEASGQYSHAEGNNTKAQGNYSHAAGIQTIASGEAQTVVGRYNTANSTSLFIVGGGTSNTNRKNIFEVTESGIKVGGTLLKTKDLVVTYADGTSETIKMVVF